METTEKTRTARAAPFESINLHVAVNGWLYEFDRALQRQDVASASALFLPDGHWRDVLAFTWHLETMNGRPSIEATLTRTLAQTQARSFRLAEGRTPPRLVRRTEIETIEALIEFETVFGAGVGVLRLVPDPAQPDRMLAWILLTSLQSLRGHSELSGPVRPDDIKNSREWGGENWLDRLNKRRQYIDRDPTVMVIGGGQAGLSAAARLQQLGVDTLIVDRHPRIGDNWRKRYHSLTLHNEVHVNHLPYLPFPPTWPVFIPKDKLANWFEAYVESLELNYWTGTELVGGDYDAAEERWSVTLRRADGSERAMRPRHLVFATGVSSIPVMPKLPGLDSFVGTVMHSELFTSGAEWKDKRALVLGTGNSGHDVAQDLQASGAQVSMIQRTQTYIVSLIEAQKVYAIYGEGIPTEDCDVLATSFPYPVLKRSYQLSTAEMRAADKGLLDGLAARGFRLHFGEDDTGFQMMYLQRGGGYYFNVGCSDLIAEGKIGLIQYSEIDQFVPEGARLRDGRIVPADLIVLATGYENQQEVARKFLGDAIADRIGPVWGFDEGGELRNMWKRTPQPGLWFTAGSLAQCRIYSKVLALQIKACEEGLLNKALKG
jgi:putative flavoprotein involved in K+ transport